MYYEKLAALALLNVVVPEENTALVSIEYNPRVSTRQFSRQSRIS